MVREGEGVIDAHIRELRRRNLSENTKTQRRRILERLQRQVPDRDLLELSGEEIAELFDSRLIEARSRACELSHLGKFYEWAEDYLGVPSPMRNVTRPKLTRLLPKPMADDDVALALEAAEGRILRALMLAAYGGLRAHEIAPSRFEHALLYLDRPVLYIPAAKGGDQDSTTLHPELVRMFRAEPASGWVFPRLDGRPGHATADSVSSTCNRFLHGLGIKETLHSLRHWYGTKFYEASGHDLRATQEGMRHASISSTVGYTWISQGRIADAVQAIPVATRRTAS